MKRKEPSLDIEKIVKNLDFSRSASKKRKGKSPKQVVERREAMPASVRHAERVLPFFQAERPDDKRVDRAIRGCKLWLLGQARSNDVKSLGLQANMAAADCKIMSARYAAQATAQAAQTSHFIGHARSTAKFALKAEMAKAQEDAEPADEKEELGAKEPKKEKRKKEGDASGDSSGKKDASDAKVEQPRDKKKVKKEESDDEASEEVAEPPRKKQKKEHGDVHVPKKEEKKAAPEKKKVKKEESSSASSSE